MKKLKYWLCVLLSVVTVFACGSTVAYAVEQNNNMDATAVLDDLQNSTIDGEKFDVANYPYDENGKAKLLAFTEFCFSYKASLAGNYALYVYVYNPTGKTIYADKNSIQLASVYAGGQATRYDKYELKLCNASDGAVDKLFYKFRVIDDGSIFERVCKDNTARRYDVSGIELNYTGTAEDFTVGKWWIYSGFAKGCGNDENAESTLSCLTDALETVRLDVKSTYYRYNNDIKHPTQISSVYFGVSNELLQKYGTLQKIHAEWLKARTSEIAVITENNVYRNFEDYIGVDISEGSGNTCDYALFTWQRYGLDTPYGDWSYNLNFSNANGECFDRKDKLIYLFEKTGADSTVSAEELQEYMKWYSNKFGDRSVAGKYSSDLFSEVDASKTDVTIDANSKFTVDGFTTGSELGDWLLQIFGSNVNLDDIKDISPIYLIKESDLKGSDEEIANRLLVSVADVDKIKAEFETNNRLNKATVLFRFATSTYDTYVMKTHHHGDVLLPGAKPNVGYLAQETVYLDFDIIDLTFVKNNVATVIPVVSNPIDVIAGITPPPIGEAGGLPLWAWVIIGIVCLILVILFINPLSEFLLLVVKAVCAVISAPFKMIASLFKGRK